MSIPTVIVSIRNGVSDVLYQDDGVNLLIISDQADDTYLYQEMVCKIVAVDPDTGTVTLKCVDDSSTSYGRRFAGVLVSSIEFYSSDDDLYDDSED